jgi:hypothetical protein
LVNIVIFDTFWYFRIKFAILYINIRLFILYFNIIYLITTIYILLILILLIYYIFDIILLLIPMIIVIISLLPLSILFLIYLHLLSLYITTRIFSTHWNCSWLFLFICSSNLSKRIIKIQSHFRRPILICQHPCAWWDC